MGFFVYRTKDLMGDLDIILMVFCEMQRWALACTASLYFITSNSLIVLATWPLSSIVCLSLNR